MQRTIFFLLAFTITGFLFQSCSGDKSDIGAPVIIDISKGLEQNKNIKLSDVVTDVELIVLEPRMETYITNVSSLSIGEKYIMVSDNVEDRIILFTKDGKFVRHIGRKGKGPGEFHHASEVVMDAKDRFVFIVDGVRQKIIKYNTNGEFIKEQNTSEIIPARFATDIRFISDDHFLVLCKKPNNQIDEFHSLVLLDLDVNMIRKILPNNNHLNKSSTATINQGSERFYFWESSIDTVYTITPDGEVIPTNIVDVPSNKESFKVFSVNEYGGFLFVEGMNGQERINVAYDKKNDEVFSLSHQTTCDTSKIFITPTMENDLFGIEPVFIHSYNKELKKYVGLVTLDVIGQFYDLECLKKKEVILPKIRDELVELIEDEENSNNLILVLLEPQKSKR
ncbi:MAG: 6-bladed beta-propeller [Bacteroidales bacterium]|nr:6-bladed beta-propeller [Bacteroidales bacterium]